MPVAAALLVYNAEESCNLPKKSLDLWHCATCGFLWNISFEAEHVRYDGDYEGTQIHSPHFARYLSELANRWAAKFPPETRRVLEVGCGQGEFLAALALKTDTELVGYDPAIRDENLYENVEMHAALLPGADTSSHCADVVINRMTLEHIENPAAFLELNLSWLTLHGLMAVQVPNAAHTIAQAALCELQYEHVNYFTPAALVALFERLELNSIAIKIDYGEQHLSVLAHRKTSNTEQPIDLQVFDIDALQREQQSFGSRWHSRLTTAIRADQKVWLWGAGSRATAFCANLPDPNLISGAIDLNPVRQGSFVPGVNIQTYLPNYLAGQSNLCIIIMNSVYRKEIAEKLASLGSNAVFYCL
jgi:SAM-dependent methyltransferase